MTTFPQQLKRLRESQGLSQGDLAKRCICEPGHISHFENGRKLPSMPMLLRLCGALQCTPNDLLHSDQIPQIRQTTCPMCGGSGVVLVREGPCCEPVGVTCLTHPNPPTVHP